MTQPRFARYLCTLPVLALVLWCQAAAAEYANRNVVVETEQLERMLGDPNVRIVDVRPAQAYDEGHIPNAVHLGADHINDPNAHVDGALLPDGRIAAMLGARGINRDTRVVLYDDKGGFHAARLFWMLEYFGHRHAGILNGGFPKWEAEGREVTTKSPEVEPRTFALTIAPRKAASADWLLAHERDPSVVVIDVRPQKMYDAGHIPWATNIPWKQNLAADGTLKSAEDLVAHFTALDVAPEKEIAIHCQKGQASSHSYWALRALGYPRLRVYDRSWAEWGEADDLPKADG